MVTPEQCLNNAARCEELATTVQDHALRMTYSDMAAQWRKLAKQIELLELNTKELQETLAEIESRKKSN